MTLEIKTPEVVPFRTDAQKAMEYRAAMRPLVDELAAIMNRARVDGFDEVSFNIQGNTYGRFEAGPILLKKHF